MMQRGVDLARSVQDRKTVLWCTLRRSHTLHPFPTAKVLHRSSLENRLAWFALAKALSHNAALYRAHTRQEKSGSVLARVVGSLHPFTAAQWRAWCSTCPLGRAAREERAGERARVATAEPSVPDEGVPMKRPSGTAASATRKRPASRVPLVPPKLRRSLAEHRTVFQLERPTRL